MRKSIDKMFSSSPRRKSPHTAIRAEEVYSESCALVSRSTKSRCLWWTVNDGGLKHDHLYVRAHMGIGCGARMHMHGHNMACADSTSCWLWAYLDYRFMSPPLAYMSAPCAPLSGWCCAVLDWMCIPALGVERDTQSTLTLYHRSCTYTCACYVYLVYMDTLHIHTTHCQHPPSYLLCLEAWLREESNSLLTHHPPHPLWPLSEVNFRINHTTGERTCVSMCSTQ